MTSLRVLLLQFYASIADRKRGVKFIEENPNSFQELFDLACAPSSKREHIVAAWVFEPYILKRLDDLTPLLDQFLKGTQQQVHESKRRPMAKVLFLYCKKSSRRNALTKIAAIAFAMKTLHFFRKHEDWIEEEFLAYIEQKRPNCSPGFRSLINQLT